MTLSESTEVDTSNYEAPKIIQYLEGKYEDLFEKIGMSTGGYPPPSMATEHDN